MFQSKQVTSDFVFIKCSPFAFHLTRLGAARVEALTKECTNAIEFLEIDPVTTIDYVRHLEFLEEILERLDGIESEIEYAKEIYDLVEEFQVPTPPDEIEAYFNFGSILTQLRTLCERKVVDKLNLINKLNIQLSKDISSLIHEVGVIQDEANVSIFDCTTHKKRQLTLHHFLTYSKTGWSRRNQILMIANSH